MERMAIQLLAKLAGPDRLRLKCEAIGYTWNAHGEQVSILENGEAVAALTDGQVTLFDPLPDGVKDRELSEEQWAAFVALDRWRVAVHEAGHAIVAVKLGLELEHVHLAEDSNAGETCLRGFASDLESNHPRRDEDLMRRFYAAGAAAESVVFGTYNVHGIADDLVEFSKLSAQSTSVKPDFGAFVGFVVRDLQAKNVTAVATTLDDKGYLSAHRVRSLLA